MADNAIALRNEENLYQAPPAVPSLVPANLTEAIRLSELMSNASLVPQHLQGKPADCFLVVEQAQRWGMSPFAVAQCTSRISGKLMFEGKLVAAVINANGGLTKRLSFSYSGEGNERRVTVAGTLRGEAEARTVEVALKDAKTDNGSWKTQPDQQLAYHGARVWARRHMPELMLGVYSPEEFSEPQHEAPRRGPAPARASATEVASGGHAPSATEELPWYRRNPDKMKALQAAVAKLKIGESQADADGLTGAKRAAYLRDHKLLYVSMTVGREVESTQALTDDEASRVIDAANAGEFPS